jgi:MFS family permease
MESCAQSDCPSDPRTLARDWRYFTLLTFLFGFGFATYNGVFQNFLRDVLRTTPLQLGTLESLREVPGLLTALTAGTVVMLAESRVAGLGLFITAIGVGLTGFAPGFGALLALSVFWSLGFHLYSSVSPAITLALAKGEEGGRHLGRMAAVGSSSTLLALALAWIASRVLTTRPYHVYFAVAGACIGVAAILAMRLSENARGAPRARIVVRREYSLYYLLIFLEGCRRQIFAIFASFALITVYHVPLSSMLALQFVNAALISMTAPRMGRLIDRVGERRPLTIYAVGLILVFAGYATTSSVSVLFALYLLDNVLFSFSVGFTTYLHRIVRPGELTPCLAMGTTMNHIAAVLVPFSGATLWATTNNYRLPFLAGISIAVVSLVATRWLPAGARIPHEAVPEEMAPAVERL